MKQSITLYNEQENITMTAVVASTDTIASVFKKLRIDPAELTCEKNLVTPIKDLNIKENDKISFKMVGAEQTVPVNPFTAKKEAVNPFGSKQEPVNPFGAKPKEPVNPFGAKPKEAVNPFAAKQEPVNPFGAKPKDPVNPFAAKSEPVNPFGAKPADKKEAANPFGAQKGAQQGAQGQKKKRSLKEVAQDAVESEQPLSFVIRDFLKANSEKDMEALLDQFDGGEEIISPKIQPFMFCVDCKQKFCKECCEKDHKDHYTFMAEPNDFICKCQQVDEEEIILDDEQLAQAVIICFKILTMLNADDQKVLNLLDGFFDLVMTQFDFCRVTAFCSLSGDDLTMKQIIENIKQNKLTSTKNCLFQQFLKLNDDQAGELVNVYCALVTPCKIFRENIMPIIIAQLSAIKNEAFVAVAAQCKFFTESVMVPEEKKCEYAVKVLSKIFDNEVKNESSSNAILTPLLNLIINSKSAVNNNVLFKYLEIFAKLRQQINNDNKEEKAEVYIELLHSAFSFTVDKANMQKLLLSYFKAEVSRKLQEGQGGMIDGAHLVAYYLSKQGADVAKELLQIISKEVSKPLKELIKLLLKPIVNNLLTQTEAKVHTPLEITQLSTVQFFIINFTEEALENIQENLTLVYKLVFCQQKNQLAHYLAINDVKLKVCGIVDEMVVEIFKNNAVESIELANTINKLFPQDKDTIITEGVKQMAQLLKDKIQALTVANMESALIKKLQIASDESTVVADLTIKAMSNIEYPAADLCLLVRGTDFCEHMLSHDQADKTSTCPVCQFEFSDFVQANDSLKVKMFIDLFTKTCKEEFSQKEFDAKFVDEKIEEYKKLIKLLKLKPIMTLPKSTKELLTLADDNCVFCGEELHMGCDDEMVLYCPKCKTCVHETCPEGDQTEACKCGNKIFIHLNTMTYVSEAVLVKAPYFNKYGVRLHQVFGEEQFLNEDEQVLVEFLIFTEADMSHAMTIKQRKMIRDGNGFAQYLKDDDSEVYAEEWDEEEDFGGEEEYDEEEIMEMMKMMKK
ncbi:Conserved_hypothetical protein [Hexamita inflata]|uniref:Uncharacterized protein n=1 Tax=Hexamita inflata TaxID=28002 RepID=A0AA86TZF8_9EUKA|nr:Conserved hypothetical protein [Hexamita inflata]